MLITEHARTHRHSQGKFHKYSRLHKLCFTSANSMPTFGQNAHEVDPLSLFYCITIQYIPLFPSPHALFPPTPSTPLTQHHHLSYLLSLSPSLSFHLNLSLSLSIISVLPLPTVFSVLRILTHMTCFDDHSHHGQTPSTCMTSLFLNYPLISAAGGSVYLKPALKSLLTCYFMRSLERLATFDLIIEQMSFSLSVCYGVFHFGFIPLLLNLLTTPVHPIFSILTPPSSPSSFKTFLSHPVNTSTNSPPPWLHTREGDVESLQ